jgi:hypothetical protein
VFCEPSSRYCEEAYGGDVMRRVTVYFFGMLALLAAAGAMRYDYAEISALAWHAQHGFHVEFGGIRLHIPLSYEAIDPAGTFTLDVIKYSGLVRHGGGVISIGLGKWQPSLEDIEAAEARLPKGSVKVKRTKVDERTAVFAGRQGTCVEYIPEFNNSRVNEFLRKDDMRQIDCRFAGDLSAELMGSVNLKSDFYNMIQTAEPVKGTK